VIAEIPFDELDGVVEVVAAKFEAPQRRDAVTGSTIRLHTYSPDAAAKTVYLGRSPMCARFSDSHRPAIFDIVAPNATCLVATFFEKG
jgi:hypothetical protein